MLLNICHSRLVAWKVRDMRSYNDGCEMHSAFDVSATSFYGFLNNLTAPSLKNA